MFSRLQPHVLTRLDQVLGDCATPSALYQQLVARVDEGQRKRLLESTEQARKLVQLLGDGGLPRELPREDGWEYQAIVGGEKRFHQEPGGRVLARRDGAWFHFAVTTRSNARMFRVELLAYNFEIVFPHGPKGPNFLRFDLNPPGHTNESRTLRSHMHPAVDEEADYAQVPAPIFHPVELIELFISRLRW